MTDKVWSSQRRWLEGVVLRRPLGLITDLDGTIVPIAEHGAEVTVSPGARAALDRLRHRVELIAVLTGRPVRDAKRLLDLPGIELIGSHGMERQRDNGVDVAPEVLAFRPTMDAALTRLRALSEEYGFAVDDKQLSASINHRSCDPEVVETLCARIAELCVELGLHQFRARGSMEIVPPVAIHKGSALKSLAAEYDLDALLFLGDDTTDLDGFRAVRELRESGLHAVALGVVSDEGSPEVAELADVVLDGVPEVERFLTWVEALLPS
jgi:trehalose 6-phosphate phosphatase